MDFTSTRLQLIWNVDTSDRFHQRTKSFSILAPFCRIHHRATSSKSLSAMLWRIDTLLIFFSNNFRLVLIYEFTKFSAPLASPFTLLLVITSKGWGTSDLADAISIMLMYQMTVRASEGSFMTFPRPTRFV